MGLEQYKIIGEPIQGGTSRVYKAKDRNAAGALRALKAVNMKFYQDAVNEVNLIGHLYKEDTSNAFFPNIITTFLENGQFYIVEDYLDGIDLNEWLKEHGTMQKKQFLEAAKQICAFMKFFYEKTGQVYSDMKPKNVMVLEASATLTDNSRGMKLKFIDFGAAVRVNGAPQSYTEEYAAPEQYHTGNLDPRTDIFNMGATFFHMIEGRMPDPIVDSKNQQKSSTERFRFGKHVNFEIRRLIEKCVCDAPADRYQNYDELYRDLCRIENNSGLRLIMLFFLLSLVCFAGAGFSGYMADTVSRQDDQNQYDESLLRGDYAAALQIDHTNQNNIYQNLIDHFTSDEKIDSNENNFIINEIKTQAYLSENDPDYGMIMYYIGNAYWLYYFPFSDGEPDELELEQSRINASFEWLEKAVQDDNFRNSYPDLYHRAEIFYHIGKFYTEIDRRERDGTDDNAFYQEIWENIIDMTDYINDANEVTSARVCQTLLTLISRYSAKFKQNQLTFEKQKAILDAVQQKVYDTSGKITYQNNYSVEIAQNFDLNAVELKLTMLYAE